MEGENCETMTVEHIEWPFLKGQKEGGDPAVGSHAVVGDDDGHGDHYEIVVSNVVNADDLKQHESLHFDGGVVDGSSNDAQFETCLISNADLASMPGGGVVGGPPSDQIKIETFKVGDYSFDTNDSLGSTGSGGLGGPGTTSTLIPDPNDDQKLIRVYQTAMEDNDNKLITVYEIKPEMDSMVPMGQDDLSAARDVLVEIVPPDEHLQLLTDPTNLPRRLLTPTPPTPRRVMTNEELQAHLGQSVPLPPEELAAVTNSAAHTVSTSSTDSSLAELRCTLCGFVSYSREEIASHCEESHDLFLCQACNLVFKKKASLQSHARAKHNNHNLASYQGGTTPRITQKITRIIPNPMAPLSNLQPTPPVPKKMTTISTKTPPKVGKVISPITLPQHPVPVRPGAGRITKVTQAPLPLKNLDMTPEIKEILAKNKAVLPNLATVTSNHNLNNTAGRGKKKTAVTKVKEWKNSSTTIQSSSGTVATGNQALILDSRLSDPQTRNQFNSEFAKKITSQGVGPEVFGMERERLPNKGTYRLDITEREADQSDITSGCSIANLPTTPSNGEPANNGKEMLYSYDIVDTGLSSGESKVICGICSFSNVRIENVLFHCEIDHKQYFCQNGSCQLGFSSWDSLTRHMKHTHKKEK